MSERHNGKPSASPDMPKPKGTVLTSEQDAHLLAILRQAKAAEKAGDLKQALALYRQYKDEFLAIKNKTPETGITPEQLAVLAEFFKGETLDQITVPKPEELTPAYFDKMYPARQTEANTAKGLVSFRPGHWDEKLSNFVDLGPDKNETCGQAYIRAIIAEAKQFKGLTFLTESIQKPHYTNGSQQYGTKEGIDATKDPLLPIIKEVLGRGASRFDLHWHHIASQLIPKVKEKIIAQFQAKKISPPPHFDIIITPALVSNIQMTDFRPENSQTTASEWSSTAFLKQDNTDCDRVLEVGGSVDGGSANVDAIYRDSSLDNKGFRLSVVFGKP